MTTPSTPNPWASIPRTFNAEQERKWAMVAHFSLIPFGTVFPFGFLGPLIVWLAGGSRSPFVNDQGKEALNHAINVNIGYAASFGLFFLASLYQPIWFAPFVVAGLSVFGGVILPFWGAAAAHRGELYRYPFSLSFFR